MRATILTIIAALVLLAGCLPAGKLAQRCAEQYPCQVDTVLETQVRVDSFIIPWHTVEYVDTTICPPADTETVIVKELIVEVPPRVITRERIDTTTLVIYADSALVASLRYEKKQLANAYAKAQKDIAKAGRKSSWFWPFVILAVVLLLVLLRRLK